MHLSVLSVAKGPEALEANAQTSTDQCLRTCGMNWKSLGQTSIESLTDLAVLAKNRGKSHQPNLSNLL